METENKNRNFKAKSHEKNITILHGRMQRTKHRNKKTSMGGHAKRSKQKNKALNKTQQRARKNQIQGLQANRMQRSCKNKFGKRIKMMYISSIKIKHHDSPQRNRRRHHTST